MFTCCVRVFTFAGAIVLSGCTEAAPPTTEDNEAESPFDTNVVYPTADYEVLVRWLDGPAGTRPLPANNNLDVANYDGRTFLAWRTAPTHFASADAALVIVSEGPDGFRLEGELAVGTDVREPRLLSLGDRLFLYFAVLGTDPTAFEPQGTMVSEYDRGLATWGEPERVESPNDFIPWRAKVEQGVGYIVGYEGGQNIYELDGEPLRVRFFTTEDGRTWLPAFPDYPVALEGGSSETDFVFLDDGRLITVSRNEAGDEAYGFGSVICRDDASAPGLLANCRPDVRKFDSPLLFRRGDSIWLVARRNVTESGAYDLGNRDLPLEVQAGLNEVAYSLAPKRCALWQIDPEMLTATWIQDFPSRGDTCFPAMIPDVDGITLYNYTSPLEGVLDCPEWPHNCADPSWISAQVLPTNIVRLHLALP